jgi:hypothetical protein
MAGMSRWRALGREQFKALIELPSTDGKFKRRHKA